MKPTYYVRELIKGPQLDEVKHLLPNVEFEDGLSTMTGWPWGNDEEVKLYHTIKKCLNNCGGDSATTDISRRIYDAMDSDHKFLKFTAASHTTEPIISRTEVGGYYRAHHDYGSNGHYSTTIFLNDPSEYEGGELRIMVGDEVKSFKLPAGHAVTYDTGQPHEVTTVTSGHRDVAVLWTTTKIADPFLRDIYKDLNILQDLYEVETYDSIEDAMKSPVFIVNQILQKIHRRYSTG